MSEGQEKPKQRTSPGPEKPPDEPGIRWQPVQDAWKRNRTDHWVAISTEPGQTPPDELDNLSKKPPPKMGSVTEEEARKSEEDWFPNIGEGLTRGDKDLSE